MLPAAVSLHEKNLFKTRLCSCHRYNDALIRRHFLLCKLDRFGASAFAASTQHVEDDALKASLRFAMAKNNKGGNGRRQLPKCPTGITGLDEITGGGVPRGRPTLVCGSAGCGKSLLSMEFLVRGAIEFNE